jgi:bifunctional non-homologous end joining protein LigD
LAEPLDTKALARELSARVAAALDLVVLEMKRTVRAGRVYVDWLQNDPSRQTVAAYSLRGMPWPLVATPVTWDEVEAAAGGRPEQLVFGPADVLARIERDGDLFEPLR